MAYLKNLIESDLSFFSLLSKPLKNSLTFSEEYVYPFIEATAYFSEDIPDKPDPDDDKSPSSEKAPATSSTASTSNNIESRAHSLGSKPKPVKSRRAPTVSSNSLCQPQGESTTGSLNTVGSIAEEEDVPEDEEGKWCLDSSIGFLKSYKFKRPPN